ncbi:hypothetical protein K474DRAFT_1705611 [Panus rudis PR-1116 ss-1]|nr:hypothetical protein K474DRAFT_1705611 [Panus rudis PR-1116 ss-1]
MSEKQPSSKPVLDKKHCIAMIRDFPICDYTVVTWALIGFTVAVFLWYVIYGIPLMRRFRRWRAARKVRGDFLDPLDPEKGHIYDETVYHPSFQHSQPRRRWQSTDESAVGYRDEPEEFIRVRSRLDNFRFPHNLPPQKHAPSGPLPSVPLSPRSRYTGPALPDSPMIPPGLFSEDGRPFDFPPAAYLDYSMSHLDQIKRHKGTELL